MYPAWSKIALTAGLIASATAQTYSECNPMKKSCDPNDGLSKSSYSVDFTKGADDDNWEFTGHGEVKYGSDGAEFTVGKKNDSPTIQSKWYMLFGRLEVHLKAAPGTGIVSSVVLLSDVLDEVDWEWLGGSGGEVQTNYYGKGNSEADTRSATFPVADNQAEFHNYTIHWTKDSCEWIINDKTVRSLKFAEALGGENYPQTPMRVKLGIWAGGDPDNAEGTIEWAGGETDYDGAPYTMTVQKIKIENLSPAESYTYSDKSGSYESIEFDKKDDGGDDDSDDDDEDSSSASETASETGSETGSETTMATATKTDSDASTTASNDSADFKNNKAAATSGADATSEESSASATADSSESGAAGNWPKMWLALGAFAAAMAMM
ncbi:hypothetical protein FSARC_9125 [Fusarium sarcochroum]|uniref:Crh-like protein n=1 Tax=Fusarium sarcochroum TaxID=1208366 RepID=A0A8H4TRI1_9HYPO|nr:hypothetical protein FSARC_9125 [Fusarium sarcochroum]